MYIQLYTYIGIDIYYNIRILFFIYKIFILSHIFIISYQISSISILCFYWGFSLLTCFPGLCKITWKTKFQVVSIYNDNCIKKSSVPGAKWLFCKYLVVPVSQFLIFIMNVLIWSLSLSILYFWIGFWNFSFNDIKLLLLLLNTIILTNNY